MSGNKSSPRPCDTTRRNPPSALRLTQLKASLVPGSFPVLLDQKAPSNSLEKLEFDHASKEPGTRDDSCGFRRTVIFSSLVL
jgi:hypothetical protein